MKFIKRKKQLILSYVADREGSGWIYRRIESEGSVKIGKRFIFTRSDVISELIEELEDEDNFDPVEFILAEIKNGYYRIKKRKLGLRNTLYIHKDINITRKTFIAERDISIFGRIDSLTSEDIYIGGSHENAIPEVEFLRLLSLFPTSNELTRYAMSRIASVISEYMNLNDDYFDKFQRARNLRGDITTDLVFKHVAEYESIKYEAIYTKLKAMLEKQDDYSEHQWQIEIAEILQIIHPKYVNVIREPPIQDSFQNMTRRVDFLLVDAMGNIDIAEIKKPSNGTIITSRTYRGNHVPMRELSGTIMQIEKYIFLLNRWGAAGEKVLNRRYGKELYGNMEIKITNPCGIIIAGRSNNLSENQMLDFEVIRRKYKNIIDIMTYDDLLQRLENIIKHWRKKI